MSLNWDTRRMQLCAALAAAVIVPLSGSPVACLAAPPHAAGCTKIVLTGEVSAAQQWSQPIGQGWVFGVIPVQPGKERYTGWDLVVDRDPPAGYPDPLLVATPPYYSISEREVATTRGDSVAPSTALGWAPER